MSQDRAQTLRAGGIVPPGAEPGDGEAVDRVVARAYRHPALPGRTVVRLAAETTVAAGDIEMATLGFGEAEDRGAVGQERRRALGFPGWALVHDPDNARHALEVVQEFKKCARRAKSRPGNARDGIDAIAARLGRTVPQFLPSFYEEAGRAFLEHGAPGFAAAMFGKARAAEAVHALAVDEQRRVDAFLEFTLAGAVTTKALTEYARQLADHHEPAAAYRHFRQLCVQRTLGGMPPWAGMARDLRRLARAAGLDPDAEDARLVAEIMESPALAMAANEFWRAYEAAIVALGRRSPAVRRALLELFPMSPTDGAELDDAWLDLLERTGALDDMAGGAADAVPSGGAAAWFDKLTHHLARRWQTPWIGGRAFAVLRRIAPRLIADGAPITCAARWNRVDLDLAELALELGVAVEPPEGAAIDLGEWAQRASEPGRCCDPVRVAAHPRLGPLLGEAIAAAIGSEPFDAVARGKAGLLAAKRAWLEALLARAESRALPDLDDVLATVAARVKPATFAELPDLHRRLAAIDVAPALARTLQIGLLDELGWPALEDAERELRPDGKAEVTLHGGLPAVVLASRTRAIAVGPSGRLAVHDLVIPARHELVTVRYIGGQFLVVLKEGFSVRGYWSGAPRELFDSDASVWHIPQIAARAVVLADGAWQEGARPIRAGDRAVPQAGLVSHDGATAWIAAIVELRDRMREVSASGEPGRVSWPAWLEAERAPDWHLDGERSYVLPAPAGLARSPLGIQDGMLGARAVYQGDPQRPTARAAVGIDGRRWTGPAEHAVGGLVELPGGERRPVVARTVWQQGTTTSLLDAAGGMRGASFGPRDRRTWRGSVAPYPDALWHALAARDAAGSQRLRAITVRDARRLIDGLDGVAELADAVPVERVARELPEITHDRLRRGVAGVIALAAQLQRERDRLRDDRAPGRDRARPAGGPDDAAIRRALAGWLGAPSWYGSTEGSAVHQIARCGELFRSGDRRDRVVLDAPVSHIGWFGVAVAPGALAFLATAIGVPEADRRAIADLRAVIAHELPDPSRLRWWSGVRTAPPGTDEARAALVLRWWRGNAYAINARHVHGDQVEVLEYAPDGAFQVPPALALGDAMRGVAAGVAAAAAPPRASVGDAPALASATGLTASEAVYLLAGCPGLETSVANFLDKERRELLGLKANQAAVARDALSAIPRGKRLAVLDEAGRGGDLAQAWNRIVGKRIAIPEELAAQAGRELEAPIPASQALAMLCGAAEAPQLTVDAAWRIDPRGELVLGGSAEPAGQGRGVPAAFSAEVLQTACVYLPFLYAELPVGHPVRAQAPVAHALVRARLASPQLLLELPSQVLHGAHRATLDRLVAALGGEPVTGLAEGVIGHRVPGAVIVLEVAGPAALPGWLRLKLKLRPATLDDRTAAVLAPLVAAMPERYSAWHALGFARSDDLAAMMARITDTPVPAGGWEQNPAASAAALVERAARRLELSGDAAALYLQYLALLWPTPKNLLRWNGWNAGRLGAAHAELAGRALILEARRERAQRSYFLPGGWDALRSPHPPMERWKLPLYGRRSGDAALPILDRFAALAPFHLLFERAWQRIEAGDVPRYDEVTR